MVDHASSSHDTSRPVAIVGAGYLGSCIARALCGPVVATTRSGRWRDDGEPPDHVQMAALDVCDPGLDPGPLLEARAVVICVAPGRTQDRRALYVNGTRRVLERLAEAPLQRVVWIGSTSALPARDAWLDERCTERPGEERGQVQRDAEQVVAEVAEARGVPWWVLRLGGIYGPERELSRIYRRRGAEPLPGNGMAPTNLVHRDDAVAAVVAALSAPPHASGIVHVVDDDHVPRRVMYARIADREGWEPLAWAEPAPRGAVPRGKRVSNLRLKHELGVRLRHPTHHLGQ